MAKALPVLGQVEPRRERADAQKNRVRILDAARKMMKKRAIDELCMDELAALAGVGKGTLYRRFEDKSSLLRALLDDSERALQEEVQRSFGRVQARPAAALLALLDTLFCFVVDHARVLAAVEASARGTAIYASGPYAWRHAIIRALLEKARVASGPAAEQIADMLLASMCADVVQRAVESRPADDVRADAHRFFASVVGDGIGGASA
jgi:AcrR family transcriptional regulator